MFCGRILSRLETRMSEQPIAKREWSWDRTINVRCNDSFVTIGLGTSSYG